VPEVVRTVCQSCHSECGVLAHVENGRVVRLQGDPDHPNNKGFICVKGKAEPQRLYHPDRLLYPLKRAGSRGEGKWQQVSWDEALDGIAAGLTAVRDQYGADAICGMRGTGPRAGGVSNLVPYALGSPNAISCDLHICYAPSLIAENVTIGTSVLMERGPDYENARCILIFGANPMVSHPPRGRDLMRGRINNGAKLIVVDPRRTYLASKADLWLQIRPGTDAALVLGLINLVIEQGLYDKDFVERWCIGFDELAARAAEYPVERVAEITWLPAEKIRETAWLYATTKPAVLHHRVAMDQNLCSTRSSQTMIDLVAITGNLDVEGGNLLPPRIPGYYRTGILSGGAVCAPPPEVEERRLGAERFPLAASPRGRFCGGPTLMFVHARVGMEAMEGKAAHPLKAMYCSGGNPLVTTMDVRRFRDAMLNLKLLVVADYFMTPTAEIADYVLPATTWLERDELCDDGYTDYIAARQKAVEPQGEARDDLEIVMDLIKRIPWADKARIPWDSPAECYDWMVAGMGLTFAELKERGYYREPRRYRKYEQNGFDTRSGKVELAAGRFADLGYDPLPDYVEPSESPVSSPALLAEYPLILITGARQIEYMTSEGRQMPRLRGQRPDPEIEMHPETAARLEAAAGGWVWLETPRKPGERVKLKVRLTEGIDPRVVGAAYGWWFPERPGPEHGCFDSNVNVVLDMGPPWEEICGSVPLRGTLCRLTAASDLTPETVPAP
jgi:anaerobic selenocysteine-containing dehydrogenase